MIIELEDVELCSDMVTYSCKGSVAEYSFSGFHSLLTKAGFRIVHLPKRGVLIANRPGAMFMLTEDCRFDLSRLNSPEEAEKLVSELYQLDGAVE